MPISRRFFLSVVFAICAPFAVAADRPVVATTFTIIADMARHVAGDHAEVVSITKPGAEIHYYEPTPQDLIRAQKADLILWNGLHLETWFERFFSNIKDVPSFIVTEGIVPLSIHGGEYDGKPNPHAWMSMQNAHVYVDNIAKALASIDPQNTANYQKNAETYKAQLDALHADIQKRVAAIPEDKRWLVTSEGAFSYLAADIGFREAYLWPINAEQQGTPQQIRALIETVRAAQIPVVFSESTVSDQPARQVAQESGARYGGVLYVDSLSTADGPVPTFLDLLKVTTDTLLKGFEEQ
ncbi:MAG: metal ABC transporter substrate-binding protein [Cardiobacteriaceae bacterium]|nr:metal ABC transporter substrate-binding protein [Cardiobacteriaceae bacterium]